MKRLSTLFLALTLIAFAGTSCKKELEGNSNPISNSNPIKKLSSITLSQDGNEVQKRSYRWDEDLLVEEILTIDGNNYIFQYSYDNNNRISVVKCTSENVFYKYIYNGDKLIKIEDYYDNVLGSTTDFLYTDEGTPYIVEIVIKVYTKSLAKKISESPINPFFFLPNEIANSISQSIRKTKDLHEISYTLIYDNNKNISEIRSQSMVYEFKYDNKCNPFSGFYHVYDSETDYLAIQFDRTFNFINRNNIVEWKRSIPSFGEHDTPIVVKLEYTYSNDYPTTQTLIDDHNGTVIKTTYTYL